MNKNRIACFMLVFAIALGCNAQTLTINTSVSIDDSPGTDPDDLFPTVFTEVSSGIYEFTGDYIDIVDGAQVVMTGITVSFPLSTGIKVNAGTSLVIDNCTLNGAGLAFDEYWGGIDVIGTGSEPQYTSLPFPWVPNPADMGILNSAHFGILELINGTKIMDSHSIISYSGGIIHTRNASFEDCKTGVAVTHYIHEYPTIDAGNVNEINACKFEETKFTRQKDKDGLSYTVLNNCYLNSVKGVNFYGCTFENLTMKSSTYPQYCSERGRGIYAIASSFKLQNNGTGSIDPISKCVKYNGTTACTFLGFYTGVWAEMDLWGYFDTYTMAAENVLFNDCVQGAAILDGEHHVFASCAFNNSNLKDYVDLPLSYCNQFMLSGICGGLFFGGCREIIVTNCTFTLTDDIGTGNAFLTLRDMGNYSSFVYKNTFTNTCSTCTKGLSPSSSITGINFDHGSNKGVQIKCNTFNDNHYSIVFNNCEVPTIFSGGPNTSTGNKFYGTNNEIWDEQTNAVNYIYNSFDPDEFVTSVNGGNNNSHSVTFTSTTGNETSCPGWDCKGWPLSNADINDLDIAVFPNPANSQLNIQFEESYTPDEMTVQVIDVTGRMITISYLWEGDLMIVDVTGLNKGVYLLRFHIRDAVTSVRFVKN